VRCPRVLVELVTCEREVVEADRDEIRWTRKARS
jgi:hypothetical protein